MHGLHNTGWIQANLDIFMIMCNCCYFNDAKWFSFWKMPQHYTIAYTEGKKIFKKSSMFSNKYKTFTLNHLFHYICVHRFFFIRIYLNYLCEKRKHPGRRPQMCDSMFNTSERFVSTYRTILYIFDHPIRHPTLDI